MNFPVSSQKAEQLTAKMAHLGILEKDLEEKFIHSGGPGGQKRNKTAACVYLRHIPTGLAVKVARDRSQGMNRFFARREMVLQYEEKILGVQSVRSSAREKIRKQKMKRKRRTRKKQQSKSGE